MFVLGSTNIFCFRKRTNVCVNGIISSIQKISNVHVDGAVFPLVPDALGDAVLALELVVEIVCVAW